MKSSAREFVLSEAFSRWADHFFAVGADLRERSLPIRRKRKIHLKRVGKILLFPFVLCWILVQESWKHWLIKDKNVNPKKCFENEYIRKIN